jgi:hypothetical protein
LEESLVGGNEDAGGSILLAVGGAGSVGIVSSLGLTYTSTVKVRLYKGLCNLAIVVDDSEIVVSGIISVGRGMMRQKMNLQRHQGWRIGWERIRLELLIFD